MRSARAASASRTVDPFDRMLVAQALTDDLTLVSNEASFEASAVRRLW